MHNTCLRSSHSWSRGGQLILGVEEAVGIADNEARFVNGGVRKNQLQRCPVRGRQRTSPAVFGSARDLAEEGSIKFARALA